MSLLIIDASVALKWFLPDENYSRNALQLLDKYIENEITFAAPSLLEYEVVNGLIVAQRKGRIPKEAILTAIDGFINLGIGLQNISHLFEKVIHLCITCNISAYDASYLAIAQEKRAPLITADERLFNSIKEEVSWVKWLGDF